tara:strand:+ start:2018 stop:2206 length:189 start_codon:yes stop_codon:yes gene_type:complete
MQPAAAAQIALPAVALTWFKQIALQSGRAPSTRAELVEIDPHGILNVPEAVAAQMLAAPVSA